MHELDHEQVVYCHNKELGLKAIIAIHDTTLGPALGGCRFYDYGSEADALKDVLRLSRGMTYKAAVAGLDLGGGKAVIMGDPATKTDAMMRAFGRHVASLGGRYITAEDMNTNEHDMNTIRRETEWVTGVSKHIGGSGDPGPSTAFGVFQGVRACLEVVYGSSDVRGRTIAIQGVGSVGFQLARHLHEGGAKLVYSDVNDRNIARAMESFGGQVVDGKDFWATECDVLAPCAIGGVVHERNIGSIRAPIIAGSANNVLEDEARDSVLLTEQQITYAPDYVINAGGLMAVSAELNGWPHEKAMEDAAGIFDTVKRVLNKATSAGITTLAASDALAEERIANAASLQRMRLP
ncbi:MAG: Glu/Leu/Phe/Val dehydrogenase [Deltaproteobacteria bacterium]|nr:MAG: Glu/Leu/Phe/Val dehydrogenase [Deltaproteobacteria bacterium]